MAVSFSPSYYLLIKPTLKRIPSIFVVAAEAKNRRMVTTTTQASHSSSYTTIKHRATLERTIKKSKFIVIAAPISDDQSARSFLSEVSDQRATHNCWAYKIGDQYRSSDDGEPSGTAGRPIYSAISTSGLDGVMVVVIRYFGGIKLGATGLVRAYGGVASECLKNAPTFLVKPKVAIIVEIPYDLLGALFHQMHSFEVEDVMQDYETGKEGITSISFRVDYDKVDSLEDAVKANCSRDILFYKGESFVDPIHT